MSLSRTLRRLRGARPRDVRRRGGSRSAWRWWQGCRWASCWRSTRRRLGALGEALHAWLIEQAEAGAHPAGTLVLIGTFLAPFLAVPLAARLAHGRRPASLIGPTRWAARDFGLAVAASGAVSAGYLALWGIAFDAEPGLAPGAWALYALPALGLLLIQTGAEEMLFRGYLQTQARRTVPLAARLGGAAEPRLRRAALGSGAAPGQRRGDRGGRPPPSG